MIGTRKKESLTIEEHRQVGRALFEANRAVITAMRLVSGRRGVKAPLLDQYLRIDRHLQRLRSEMDTLMFVEHRTGVNTDLYYPREIAGDAQQ
jgi:hypothetical protein